MPAPEHSHSKTYWLQFDKPGFFTLYVESDSPFTIFTFSSQKWLNTTSSSANRYYYSGGNWLSDGPVGPSSTVYTGADTFINVYSSHNVMDGAVVYFPQNLFTSLATITTITPVTNISTNKVDVAGNVSSDGGATITERGFVYNTSSNPTTSNSKAAVSGTTGAMSTTITGLTPNTTYYVRAFATNAVGTSYGDNVSFETLASLSSRKQLILKLGLRI